MQIRWFHVGLYTFISSLLLAGAFFTGYYTHSVNAGIVAQYPLLIEAEQLISKNYLGELPTEQEFEYSMIRGLVEEIDDPYTFFVEPQRAELDSDERAGAFGGIGSTLSQNEQGQFVLEPFRDSPAASAGILAGDLLLAVDDVTLTAENSVDDVVALVRGEVGTDVQLEVQTGEDESRVVTIERQNFEIPSTTWRVLEQDATIGLIDANRFSQRTPDEIELALEELGAAGATRLILDLRSNRGGLLDASVDVAGLFLDGGVVLFEERRDRPEKTFEAESRTPAADIPMVILIDNGSASAAEIVAGALRDRGRAPLIGQASFGKGSVQLVFELEDGSSLHITNARWMTPARTPIDGVGLEPDIILPTEQSEAASDVAIDRAIEYLNNLP